MTRKAVDIPVRYTQYETSWHVKRLPPYYQSVNRVAYYSRVDRGEEGGVSFEPMSTAQSMLKPQTFGRPRKYQDIDDFQREIDAYFAGRDAAEKPYTMHGLARHLDCTRNTLLRYEEIHDDRAFSLAVKRARERVAEWTEERLYRAGQHPAGPIFSLKNNFGWKDEQSVAVNVAVAVGIMAGDEARRGLLPDLVIEQIRPENAVGPPLGTDFVSLSPLAAPTTGEGQ